MNCSSVHVCFVYMMVSPYFAPLVGHSSFCNYRRLLLTVPCHQSVLGAIAHGLVTLFLGAPPEEHYPRPRVEPALLAPTLHSRNASTASLYSVALSQDTDSFAQTLTDTISSEKPSQPLAGQDAPQTPSPPLSRSNSIPGSSSQATASGSNILQLSKDVVARGHAPIRRIASQIQEDCKKRRATRKSSSPLQLTVSLPPPLTPIPSAAEPSTPVPPSEIPSFASGSDSPRPAVGRAVTTPTSSMSSPVSTAFLALTCRPRLVHSPKKWLPRRQNTAPQQRPAPLARTDPYQAPYFFPTPLSPEAADYVRQVRISRSAAVVSAGTVFEQRLCDVGPSRARTRSRETSVDERPSAGGRVKAAEAPVAEGGERAEEKAKERLEGLGKLKQLPNRRLSWHPVPVVEEPASAAVARASGADSAPNSPNGFLRKSRRFVSPFRGSAAAMADGRVDSLLRAPEPLTPVSGASESGTKPRSRSGPSPSPDTREGSSHRSRKKFSLLEKIHHRRSYSGDKASTSTTS